MIVDNIRTCRRCGKHFGLRENGEYIKKEECIYHWGKAFQKRGLFVLLSYWQI